MKEPTFKNGEVLWHWGEDEGSTVVNNGSGLIAIYEDGYSGEIILHPSDIEPLIQCLQAALNHVKSESSGRKS